MFSTPGLTEIIVILVIVLVLFGSKKLPEIGTGIGRAINNFKKATSEPEEIDITPTAEKKKEEQKKERTKEDA